ncbi:MAG: ABC transporter permease [Coriobacteriales bacterium]|jgi:teichoic acid transport system permease protein|nr:ABC transporter permease [Coriobacteriales bacterium]
MRTLYEIFYWNIKQFPIVWALTRTELRKELHDGALGWFWMIAKPIIYVGVFSLAMIVGFKQGKGTVDTMPYILWLGAGIIPWFFMQRMITSGVRSIKQQRKLMQRGLLHPVCLTGVVALPEFLTLAIGFCVNFIICVIYLHAPTIHWLMLPLLFVGMYVFFNIVALTTSMIATVFPDMISICKFLSTPLFWLSGILFNIDNMHSHVISWVLAFNPVTFFDEAIRDCFEGQWFFLDKRADLGFLVVLVATVLVCVYFCHHLRAEVRDVEV